MFHEKNVDAVNNDDDDDEANLIYDHGGFKNTTFSHVNRPSFLFVIIISYIYGTYTECVNYSHVYLVYVQSDCTSTYIHKNVE